MRNRAPLLWAALLLLTALSVSPAVPAHAGQAALVADLAPGPSGAESDPFLAPRELVTSAGRTFFFTGGRITGEFGITETDLWGTDGTESGTELLAVLCTPPSGCSFPPSILGSLDDRGVVLFQVDSGDGTGSAPLWRTDGTRSGTYPLAGPFAYRTDRVVRFGRLHYFQACLPAGPCSLWHTDGTAAGTGPGPVLNNSSIVVFKGRLFFLTNGSRAALWTSDGTAEGTRLVRRLPDGEGNLLTVAGGHLYFVGGLNGEELWTSDGTRAGTRFVRMFGEMDDDGFGRIESFKPWGERVLFVGSPSGTFNRNLWVSDGTLQGTRKLTRFPSQGLIGYVSESQSPIFRNRVFFVVYTNAGPQLWSTRGTRDTTVPLSGCPGGCPTLDFAAPLVRFGPGLLIPGIDGLRITDGTGPGTRRLHNGPVDDIVPAGDLVYFASGSSLWRTDGTLDGTERLAEIPTRPDRRLDLVALGSRAVFPGSDPEHGAQPWITDGTPEGTHLLANLGGGGGASSMPADLTALGARLLFTAENVENADERSVWSSDGSAAGTLALADADLDSPPPAGLVRAGGLGYFSFDAGTHAELWRTDGSPAGTVAVAEFPDRIVGKLSEVGGRLVALVSSTLGERPVHSLWTSDGTPAGTRKILDLADDTVEIGSWIPLGSELFFTAARETRQDIYRTDGTAAGTRAILETGCFNCTLGEVPIEAVRKADGKVILFAQGVEDGRRNVWQTDGTPEGTVALLPSPSTGANRIESPTAPAAFGNDIVFFANSYELEFPYWGLWRLHGSDLTLLSPAGSTGYDWVNLTPPLDDGHGHLIFSALDRDHGRELWRTDGTPAGTVLLADILPGPVSSDPEGLTRAGGHIVFSVQDGIHGRELWTTDGTASGTRLLEDIAPGGASSSPRSFTAVGGKLFFTADDGTTGREPWVRPLDF